MPGKAAWASLHPKSFDILTRRAKQNESGLGRAPTSVFNLRFELTPFPFIYIVGYKK